MYGWIRTALYTGCLLVCALSFAVPLPAWSAKASLLLHPTLVTFEGSQRSHSLYLVNHGDATGVFEISWVDFSMTPEGGLMKWDAPPPWSLQDYVRYSPRRVTLRPGETQTVKIALRRTQAVSEGEYLSHLKFLTIHESVDGEPDDNKQSTGLMIKARAGMTIPIVWRNTSATPRAMIDSAQIDLKAHQITVDVQRLGSLSTRGYLHVFHHTADGQQSLVAGPFPLVIYQNLEKRTISVPLNPGVVLSPGAGSIEVLYSEDAQNQGASLASHRMEF